MVTNVSETYVTRLRSLHGYQFNVKFDGEEILGLVVDETKPTGEDKGPDPSRLLSAAVGHCLGSSLLYCLSKARIRAKNLETTVKLQTARNEEARAVPHKPLTLSSRQAMS
jgi:uncharacterized OsmC-like protein